MPPSSLPTTWCEALSSASHPLSPEAADKLLAYAKALTAASRRPNLTGLNSVERVIEVLLRPSLLLAWAVEAPPTHVADIGSGNGFPGIVAAALWPKAQICLIERRARKAAAIRTLASDTGFEVEVLACDAREVPREGPQWLGVCDLVTLRAVGDLASTTRLAAPLLAPRGRVVHWKTSDLSAEERREGHQMAASLRLTARPDVTNGALATARLITYERSR